MIHHLEDLRAGFERSVDAVVVGSGAGGAVAALNLAQAGMKTLVLEAGPEVKPADSTRDAPAFLSRFFWEGGLRTTGGSAETPAMGGRCLGGSTVVNSAIMLALPDWVRREWARAEGLDTILGPELDAAFERVFRDTGTAPTPMGVMGRRNLLALEALGAAGIEGGALPRAVIDCKGCADCLIGCFEERKQSVDRSYLPRAVAAGAEIATCSHVDRVLTEGQRAVGVTGYVVDPVGRRRLAPFTVRADTVFLAGGALNTPGILLQSGIHANRTVGRTLFAHIGAGATAIMDEVVEPWIGATQGVGAISSRVPGLKYECLWAPPSVLAVRWGGVGREFLRRLPEVKMATVVVIVYRAQVRGRVTVRRDGSPRGRIWVPKREVQVVLRELKPVADGLLKIGAQYVTTQIHGAVEEMRSERDTETLLNPRFGHKNAPMTFNHIFGSCRMSADPRRGTVDERGAVRGVEGLYLCDASIFPSPSAVNPQATIMALSDVISRGVAELREP